MKTGFRATPTSASPTPTTGSGGPTASRVAAIPTHAEQAQESSRRIGRPAPAPVDQCPGDASDRERGDEHTAEGRSSTRQRERRGGDLQCAERPADQEARPEQRRHRRRRRAPGSDAGLRAAAAGLRSQAPHATVAAPLIPAATERASPAESRAISAATRRGPVRSAISCVRKTRLYAAVRSLAGEVHPPLDPQRGRDRRKRSSGDSAEQDQWPRTGACLCRNHEPDERRRVHRTADEHDEPRSASIDEAALQWARDRHGDPHRSGHRPCDRQRPGGCSRDEHETDGPGALRELRKEAEDRLPPDWRRPPQRRVETVSRQRRHSSHALCAAMPRPAGGRMRGAMDATVDTRQRPLGRSRLIAATIGALVLASAAAGYLVTALGPQGGVAAAGHWAVALTTTLETGATVDGDRGDRVVVRRGRHELQRRQRRSQHRRDGRRRRPALRRNHLRAESGRRRGSSPVAQRQRASECSDR